jgi:FixJ family two-component response regulator
MPYRIAHVDDDLDIRESVKRILVDAEYHVESFRTISEFMESLH